MLAFEAEWNNRARAGLTKACTGAREGSFIWMSSCARAPGDASRYAAKNENNRLTSSQPRRGGTIVSPFQGLRSGCDVLPRSAPQDVEAYLAVVLDRARRVHESLNAASEVEPPVRLMAFGGDCEETLDAPVIIGDEEENRWETLVEPRELKASNGRIISRDEVMRAMFAPGDGRVTRRSMMAESSARMRRSFSPYNSSLPLQHVVFGCDLHSELHRNKTLLNNALTLLIGRQIN